MMRRAASREGISQGVQAIWGRRQGDILRQGEVVAIQPKAIYNETRDIVLWTSSYGGSRSSVECQDTHRVIAVTRLDA